MLDISDTLQSSSDYLTAAGLVTRRTYTITGVEMRSGTGMQSCENDAGKALVIFLRDSKPWVPSKTNRRLLAGLWGTDASQWVGKRVTLYNDPEITWAGKPVGGVMLCGSPDIKRARDFTLRVSKSKSRTFRIVPVEESEAQDSAAQNAADARLAAWCQENALDREAVLAWHLDTLGKPLQDVDGFFRLMADRPAGMEKLRAAASISTDDDDPGQHITPESTGYNDPDSPDDF